MQVHTLYVLVAGCVGGPDPYKGQVHPSSSSGGMYPRSLKDDFLSTLNLASARIPDCWNLKGLIQPPYLLINSHPGLSDVFRLCSVGTRVAIAAIQGLRMHAYHCLRSIPFVSCEPTRRITITFGIVPNSSLTGLPGMAQVIPVGSMSSEVGTSYGLDLCNTTVSGVGRDGWAPGTGLFWDATI